MGKTRFAVPILLIAAIVVLAYPRFRSAFTDPENRSLPPAVFKLRRIENALAQYFHEHEAMPFDERGHRHALYKLHSLIDAADFQLFDQSHAPPPKWDHSKQALVGGDAVYLNQPITERYPSRVVLYAIPPAGKTSTWIVHSGFGILSASFPIPPNHDLLGSFETDENVYVRKIDTYYDFILTHNRLSSQSWDSRVGVVSRSGPEAKITYRYKSGRLSMCTVTLANGRITETVETDELGQIVSIRRTPENWRELLPDSAR